MKRLIGIKIDRLDFPPIKQGDLLYHEGPLLSVFKDGLSDNFHFYKWSDCDSVAHRWLVFKVTINHLKMFFDKLISIRQLIMEQPFSYFLDLDDDLKPIHIVVVPTHNIPQIYLPEADSYFEPTQFEDYALVLQQKLKEKDLLVA